ncbi:MAG: AzlD domain-containing protein [Burkholderiales bacterium]|nr:AzlD domain-containing protein [Burkholderiales bacterium]MDE2287083.1 AzlD domain-containing protein [Burkholderiales bacterium]MDE2609495.1 AzlD domain-containing protein [Burkholderiales bacterium]
MSTWQIWLAIVAMMVVTILLRAGFLLAGERVVLPARVQRALRYAPAAALAAIVVPDTLLWQDRFLFSIGNPQLISGVFAIAWYAWRRKMLEMILLGMMVFTIARLYL